MEAYDEFFIINNKNLTTENYKSKNEYINIEMDNDAKIINLNFYNKKINSKVNISKNKKNYSFYLIIYLFFIILQVINSKIFTILSLQNSIVLNINKTGSHKIFHSNFSNEVIKVKINGNNREDVSYQQNFAQANNSIELTLKQNQTNFSYLFFECSNITKIDLSNFTSTSINQTTSMFHGCSSLTSIDFMNFKTNSVINMFNMFNGCSSLLSLNLSSFNTSLVDKMGCMFQDCKLNTNLFLLS